jgi:hypothetical protein
MDGPATTRPVFGRRAAGPGGFPTVGNRYRTGPKIGRQRGAYRMLRSMSSVASPTCLTATPPQDPSSRPAGRY